MSNREFIPLETEEDFDFIEDENFDNKNLPGITNSYESQSAAENTNIYTIKPEQKKEIYSIVNPIIQTIVEISKPKGKELFGDTQHESHEVLSEWQENIYQNFNKITGAKPDQVFDTKTYREGFLMDLNDEEKDLKRIERLKYKYFKKNVKRFFNGKKKRELLNPKRTEKRNKINEISKKYDAERETNQPADGNDWDDQIGFISREFYDLKTNLETERDDEIEYLEKKLHKRRSGFTNFFIDLFKRTSIETDREKSGRYIDPLKDFILNDGTSFTIKPLNNKEEITPLVTPKAKDSLMESEGFELIQALDENSELSNEEKQVEFEKILIGDQSIISKSEQSEAQVKWEKLQRENRDKELRENYSKLYNLFPEKEKWEENKSTEKGYTLDDDQYIADKTTLDEFKTWLIAKGKDPVNYIKDRMSGWEIDEIKMNILIEMSNEIINEQKWAITPEITKFQSDFEKAGEVKQEFVDKKIAEGGDSNYGFAKEGKYAEQNQKRNPGYSAITGYIPPTPESKSKVEEEIIWMINFKTEMKNTQ